MTQEYGKVFDRNGVLYVEFDGGAILLSHAIERTQGSGAIVMLDGQEGFIKDAYGPAWWSKATLQDVRRMIVR